MVDADIVLIEYVGPVAIVRLNRPEAMNALSRALGERIQTAFEEVAANKDIRVAILTGNGRAFCAGMDLKELASGQMGLQAPDEEFGAGHTRFGMGVFKGPIIAAINGFAMTGGLELALVCDVRIAANTAKFADTHSRVGVIPGGSMTALLSRLIGLGRAKEMSLGGGVIDAETADRWGLVNRVLPPEELMPFCLKLAQEMAVPEPGYLQKYNQLIEDNYRMTYADALDHEHATSKAANQAFDKGGVDLDSMAARARKQ